ncbi:MAG: DUF3276 family protein [Rikenellaceae bacterium]
MAYYQDNYRSGGYGSRAESVEDEVFSVPVKAGKRIYYFDVKATRGDDYYVTITESRKKPLRDGGFAIDKHKIHLYKEDFMKFAAGLQDVLEYIRKEKPDFAEAEARGDFNKPYEGASSEASSATGDMEKELFGNY